MGILLSIFVTICLINPALSIAQNIVTQNDSTANCINLEAKAQSKAKWEYQPSKSYFNGENLDIMLSWTPVQTSNPKAGANPVETVRTRSGVVMQQRSIPPLIADQLATIGITIVDNRLKDPAAVMASRHRGDGRSRPAPEKPIHPALVAAG